MLECETFINCVFDEQMHLQIRYNKAIMSNVYHLIVTR